jgi:hypothetical protein
MGACSSICPSKRLTEGITPLSRRPIRVAAVSTVVVSEQIADEVWSHTPVRRVARGDRGGGDDLGIGVDGCVALVAVETPGCGLVTVPGLGIDRRDDPVLGHPPGNAEDSVGTNVEVLADDSGEELGCLGDHRVEYSTVEDRETGVGVLGPGVDEGLACLPVIPVDLGLGRRGVGVAAGEHACQLVRQLVVGHLQQPPDGRADEGDGVHGRHRVIEWSGIEGPRSADQSGLSGCTECCFEDPVGTLRVAQTLTHVDQYRVGEAGPPTGVIATDTGCIAPPVVEAVAIDCFAIGKSFQALEHHDHGNHRRWDRATSTVGEQVAKLLVAEEPVPLPAKK